MCIVDCTNNWPLGLFLDGNLWSVHQNILDDGNKKSKFSSAVRIFKLYQLLLKSWYQFNAFSYPLIDNSYTTPEHVNNIPIMQLWGGIPRNTQSKSYVLSLIGNSKMMHCGILFNMHHYGHHWDEFTSVNQMGTPIWITRTVQNLQEIFMWVEPFVSMCSLAAQMFAGK